RLKGRFIMRGRLSMEARENEKYESHHQHSDSPTCPRKHHAASPHFPGGCYHHRQASQSRNSPGDRVPVCAGLGSSSVIVKNYLSAYHATESGHYTLTRLVHQDR